MKAGDKVICIDAGCNPAWPEYASPLIANQVYVVKEVFELPKGVAVSLLGILPPPDFNHGGFSISRFRLLSEMKSQNTNQLTKAKTV